MQFTLKAHSDAAGVVALRVDAPSADEARRQAEAMGYLVFGVNAGSRSPSALATQRLRGGGFSLLLFSQQLLSLLDAGLNLVEAIEAPQGATPIERLAALTGRTI